MVRAAFRVALFGASAPILIESRLDSSAFIAARDVAAPDFHSFMSRFGRTYESDSEEYKQRRDVYDKRMVDAHRHNSNPKRRWTAGANEQWDWTDDEISSLHGWRNMGHVTRWGESMFQSTASVIRNASKIMPKEVTYDHLNSAKNVKNQAHCGSCWAVSTGSLLEAHYELHVKKKRHFSAQELVNCVPNPQECGGTGGCHGATVELALDYVWKNGLSTTEKTPYLGANDHCVSRKTVIGHDVEFEDHSTYKGRVKFGMTGWTKLPENKLYPVMRALIDNGPIGASASARTWHQYKHGVFDNCEKDTVIGHAVLLMGYGVNNKAAGGDKYWLVQNSWGKHYGESGYIRLLRTDGEDKSYCGIDNAPHKGTACKGGPKQVKVCGMCGILYDNSIPHFDKSTKADTMSARKKSAQTVVVEEHEDDADDDDDDGDEDYDADAAESLAERDDEMGEEPQEEDDEDPSV